MPKPLAKRSSEGHGDCPDVNTALDCLKKKGSKAGIEGMARYAITSDRAFGVSMRDIQTLAKTLGRNHGLAAQLWASGWYEARMLAAYVEDPACVTAKQMDQWCQDFDNWAICDTVCFALFDRTSHAWTKVEQWSRRKQEFEKRAAFALLWGLSVHDKNASDDQFTAGLDLVERAANDERNFVKKAVNMALRAVGKRNLVLNAAAREAASRLAASANVTERWIGKDALRELTSATVIKRISKPVRTTKKISR